MKKWIVGSTIAAAAIASVLFFSTYSLGTTRYVIPGAGSTGCSNQGTNYIPGSNTCSGGAGSGATVYTSIANALSANLTVAGDRLEIRAGTYVETINSNTQNIPSGTSFANAPVISGYLSETVTIRPSGGCEAMNLVNPNTKYLIWDKLIIDAINLGSTCGTGISIGYGTHHIRVSNTEIKNVAYSGVFIGFGSATVGSDGNEFINCRIHDVNLVHGLGAGHCLYITSSNNVVEGCELDHTDGYGVHIYNGTSGQSANNNIAQNNRIHDTGSSSSAGIILSSGSGNAAYNNFLYNNQTGIQIATSSTASGSKVYNNSISNSVAQGILIQSGSSGALVKNNIITGSSTAISNNNASTQFAFNRCTALTTGCAVTGDPLFTSSTDLHLLSGSPARNSTTFVPTEFTTDFDGDSRGSAPWDAGADEFLSGATPSITVITPNGLPPVENWTIGTIQTIRWSSANVSTVDISYDPGNDSVYEVTVQNGVTASLGFFNWTVPIPATTTGKIKIASGATNDVSDAVFTVSTSSGGTITKRISDNTIGIKVGDISGLEDNFIWSLNPTTTYGAANALAINKYAVGDHNHGLFRFTGLSQIPTTATVTSVTFGLYLEDPGGTGSDTIEIRKVLRTDVEEATSSWTNYKTANSWQTAGGLGASDRTSTVSASLGPIPRTPLGYSSVTSTGQFKTDIQADVTAGTQSWFHLEDTTDADSRWNGFTSSEGTNGQRPYLEVTYTIGTSTITVTEPKAGDLFLSGQDGPVRWTSQGVSGNVNVDLSRDGGTTWEPVTTLQGVPNGSSDQSMIYSAPTSSNCKIRVVSVNDGAISGTSSAFRIGGTRAGFLLLP